MTTNKTVTGARQRVRVNVSGNAMSATMVLFPPSPGDPDITLDEVRQEIDNAEITFGVDEKAISRALEEKAYNRPTVVANGQPPRKGQPSQFEYLFETEKSYTPKEDPEGRLDYRDINFIQNTTAGQVLVTKIPPTPGEPGMTVRGKELKALPGRDVPFNSGVNTEVSEDGLALRATANGAILYKYGKVAVNDVMTISGDVDFKVGNIDCRGTVKVTGDVKTGFTIKVDGDLEVNGNVEDSTLHADGNIYVKGGFFGKGEGEMRAGGNITVKFAEGQRLASGHNVMVGGEIINCTVFAKNEVHINAKKGKIVGGDIRAGQLIKAPQIGSDAGTKTVLMVGYDAELMSQYRDVVNELRRLEEDGTRVKDALYNLYRLQIDGKIPPDKQAALAKLEKFQAELPGNMQSLKARREEIEAKLREFTDAQIIVTDIIYPGVRASFGIVYRDILEETRRCKLTLDNGQVHASALQ